MMKISNFKKYIALHGADLSHWPQDEIKPAIDLIQHDPEAGKIFLDAEKFDYILWHYPPVPVNVNRLADKIVRNARRHAVRESFSVLKSAYPFVSGGGLLVAAILGFMIGSHPMEETRQALTFGSVLYAQDRVISDGGEAF